MKNQYFGDINDYRKYGLLRSILSSSDMRLLVAWMLTPDDNSTDGKFLSYLEQPSKWSSQDSDLFSCLKSLLDSQQRRQVNLIENTGILFSSTKFFSDIVHDDSLGRKAWFASLLDQVNDCDLVFLDPDNGLEVKSKPFGHRNSSKFLYFREVEQLWQLGKSQLIYQHFIRENRQTYIHRLMEKLKYIAPSGLIEAYSTPHVVFFLLLQPEHAICNDEIARLVHERWNDQIHRWDSMGIQGGV